MGTPRWLDILRPSGGWQWTVRGWQQTVRSNPLEARLDRLGAFLERTKGDPR
jgi:hypothetical protein